MMPPDPSSSPSVRGKSILARYEELYGSGELSLSRTYADKFPLLEHLLKGEVSGKSVLDFGCGPGRLSLMLSRYADSVHGVDFSAPGIEMAKLLAHVTRTRNVEFTVGDIDAIRAGDRSYEVIIVAGTIEHLADPVEAIRSWSTALDDDGLLVLQCPSFENFRGDVYNTLGVLLGLPMSLTDVRQIHHMDVRAWAQDAQMQLVRIVGGHYSLAFMEGAVADLRSRAPKAAADEGRGSEWGWDEFFRWLDRRAGDNRLLIEALVDEDILKPIPNPRPLEPARPDGIPDERWEKLDQYLTYRGWREAHYCDVTPVSLYGASAVYFLRPGASHTSEETE